MKREDKKIWYLVVPLTFSEKFCGKYVNNRGQFG